MRARPRADGDVRWRCALDAIGVSQCHPASARCGPQRIPPPQAHPQSRPQNNEIFQLPAEALSKPFFSAHRRGEVCLWVCVGSVGMCRVAVHERAAGADDMPAGDGPGAGAEKQEGTTARRCRTAVVLSADGGGVCWLLSCGLGAFQRPIMALADGILHAPRSGPATSRTGGCCSLWRRRSLPSTGGGWHAFAQPTLARLHLPALPVRS